MFADVRPEGFGAPGDLRSAELDRAFRSDNGQLLLSRTAVSELGEQLWRDYQDFAKRDLSGYEIVYLFARGIAERIRPGQRREPVMAAWGFAKSRAIALLGAW